jgi:hypothetical protein
MVGLPSATCLDAAWQAAAAPGRDLTQADEIVRLRLLPEPGSFARSPSKSQKAALVSSIGLLLHNVRVLLDTAFLHDFDLDIVLHYSNSNSNRPTFINNWYIRVSSEPC